MDIKEQIDLERLPRHIAIIMDGNGRWAKQFGKVRIFGHRNGVKAVRETAEASAELGIKFLTMYAFSTENWDRPESEVSALMTLLVNTLRREIKTLNDNNIRLAAIGDIDRLPGKCKKELLEAIEKTQGNDRMTMILALNYSGKWDMLEAMKKMTREIKEGQLTEEQISGRVFEGFLSTVGYPDPELLIRTSGEMRISNFLLWQIAYSELYFTPVLWPDFRKEHLYNAIIDFQGRERRFGKISEQIGG